MIKTVAGTIDSSRHSDCIDKAWTDVEERFATMVRRIDDCVGDLIITFQDLEIDQNTMVVFTSDNGPHCESCLKAFDYASTSFESFGPFDGIKRDLWEGGIRMPTLVHFPAVVSPTTIDFRFVLIRNTNEKEKSCQSSHANLGC
ncbi:Sulfatase [Planctomycetes bacterium CA13]|uniref:Sulfatase n=1 Tax=Novipirellula herctigrandis TaxID=2527986 RepID=A0A5C5Z9V8_9BACT|nr:Sulfatase [Planctomycetes bacterium CA13]